MSQLTDGKLDSPRSRSYWPL